MMYDLLYDFITHLGLLNNLVYACLRILTYSRPLQRSCVLELIGASIKILAIWVTIQTCRIGSMIFLFFFLEIKFPFQIFFQHLYCEGCCFDCMLEILCSVHCLINTLFSILFCNIDIMKMYVFMMKSCFQIFIYDFSKEIDYSIPLLDVLS